jgi:hypothetical protein
VNKRIEMLGVVRQHPRLTEQQARTTFRNGIMLSEPTDEDIAALIALDQTDSPERILGAALNARGAICPHCDVVNCGLHARRGWNQHVGPGPLLRQRHPKLQPEELPDWCDHCWMVKPMNDQGVEDDRTEYHAEPYELSVQDLMDIVWLASEHGYEVWVWAGGSLHFPGKTVTVSLLPPVEVIGGNAPADREKRT